MQPRDSGRLLQIGDWVVDPAIDTISHAGVVHKLEPRTMRLLVLLAESPATLVSTERILEEVWPGVIVGTASVYQVVSQLRQLLADSDSNTPYIATVARKGYRLVAPVLVLERAPSRAQRDKATAAPQPELAGAGDPGPAISATADEQPTLLRRAVPFLLVGAVLAAAGTAAWLSFRPLAPAPPPPSIVVLPFIDMTEQHQDQAFCDGLTEELSNWLAQIPTLRVVARTTAFAYRGKAIDVRTIGRELGTTHVLEGSLRRSQQHVRITAQLVSTRDGYHVWSAFFDRPVDDVVKVQEEISRAVADNLEIRLTERATQGFAARRSGVPEAYQLYLLARHHQHDLTRDSNDRAIELYRQALTLDKNFALAYAGLALAYLNQSYLNGRSVQDIATEAEPLLSTAMRLDPALPEVYVTRGALRADQGRNEEALRDVRHAIELNPSDSAARSELGYLLITNGQPREALSSYSAAAALDPLNFNLQARRCIALTDMARFEEAEESCAHARSLSPTVSWPYIASSWLDWARGKLGDALNWNAIAIRISPNQFDLYDDRVDLLLTLGLAAEARQALERARVAANTDEGVAVRLAVVSFYEEGAAALRQHLVAARPESSAHADTLLRAARAELLLGEAAAARTLLERALAAPDLDRRPDDPWYERQGDSLELTRALVELKTGEEVSANRRLEALSSRLTRLTAAGVERFGVYKLRAEVLALRGDPDGAMAALRHAVALGWREASQAAHDPAFSSLQSRSDFRALLEEIRKMNAGAPTLG